ncbi:MAG: DNA polymerase, partial [Nitrosopumilus sp.]
MPQKIDTSKADYAAFDREEQGWIYNALDCCLTDEIFSVISAKVDAELSYAKPSYDFIRAMQGPAMTMALRGIKIDMNRRAEMIKVLEDRQTFLTKRLQRMVEAFYMPLFNPMSPVQCKRVLYDILLAPTQYKWNSKTKRREVSSDKNALEAIIKSPCFYARPICKHILKIREISKLCGTLKTGIDPDNRMRTSYNVSGTETGRWSSNKNCFTSGTNLQNITDELREVFIADDGYKFAYIDGEQAESRVVAYITGDREYIKACEGGDLHTLVAKMVWPELEWTDDDHHNKHQVAG